MAVEHVSSVRKSDIDIRPPLLLPLDHFMHGRANGAGFGDQVDVLAVAGAVAGKGAFAGAEIEIVVLAGQGLELAGQGIVPGNGDYPRCSRAA